MKAISQRSGGIKREGGRIIKIGDFRKGNKR